MSKRLTVAERQEVFQALVETQDMVSDVPRSRQMITRRFGITEGTLKQIEDEGIERQWPPLAEEAEPARLK